jgi:hypothetical protein
MVGFLMKRNGLAIFVRQAPILSDKRHFCQTRSPFVRQAPFLSDKRHFCHTSAIFIRQAPFFCETRAISIDNRAKQTTQLSHSIYFTICETSLPKNWILEALDSFQYFVS